MPQIKGLPEALADPTSNVVSNYSASTVEKTFQKMQEFKGGNAIFTFPTMPIKCPGAPQKIMYLADDYWRQVSCWQRHEEGKGSCGAGKEKGGAKGGMKRWQSTEQWIMTTRLEGLHQFGSRIEDIHVFLLQHGVRDRTDIMYNSALGVIFAVKKYAEQLLKVVDRKGIKLNFKRNLVEVDAVNKQAIFEVLEENRTESYPVSK